AKVSALLDLARVALPAMNDRLLHLRRFAGTPDEAAALHQAYELMHKADFSRDVLEMCPDKLAVCPLRGLGWSDLGSPSRVIDAIADLPVLPDWARELVAAGVTNPTFGARPRSLVRPL